MSKPIAPGCRVRIIAPNVYAGATGFALEIEPATEMDRFMTHAVIGRPIVSEMWNVLMDKALAHTDGELSFVGLVQEAELERIDDGLAEPERVQQDQGVMV